MKHNFYPISNASRQIFGLFIFFFLFALCTHAQAQIITTVAGDGTDGYTGDGGPATAAEVYYTWSLASDRAGGFYIGSDYEGVLGYNRVRRVNAAGIITTYAGNGGSPSFGGDGGPATAASFYYPGGVATDAAGNLYISDEGNYRIRKVNTSGIISTIAGTGTPGFSGDGGQATAANIESWDGDEGNNIASDPAGNVYISEWDYYRIRRIDATTGIITTIAGTGSPGHTGDGGPATAATLGFGYGIAADGAGNVYYSDWSYQCIRKINASGIISTIAGTGTAGYTGDGGPATAAEIYTLGMAVDGSGYLYLAEYTYNRIRRIDPAGIITTFAGTGTYSFSGDGGPATAATFRDVWGVATDYSGDVYAGDLENWRVREIYGHNRPVTFAGGHSLSFTVCENTVGDSTNSLLVVHDSDYWQTETWRLISGPAHGTAPDSIVALANGGIVTPSGLYYTPTFGYSGPDSFKVRVTDGYVWDTTTVHVTVNPIPSALTGTTTCFVGSYTTLGSTPSGGTWSSGAAGIATAGAATGVVFGAAAGTAAITYTLPLTGCINTTTVNVLAYAGQTISTVAGNGTAGFGGDTGPATAAEINQSYNVAFDGTGNMYIADFSNNRIRKVSTAGVITTIAGTAAAGFFGDGGAASAAKLNGPFGIAIDAPGNIYFTDGNNHCVRKINTSGTISTIAGTAGTPGLTGDGSAATSAQLYYPAGIALDGAGNIYIADEWNNRIRKVNAATGIITSIAGNGPTGYLLGGYGGDGGAATSAQINYPEGVTLDGLGNIYITDGGNQRVRKISTAGTITTVAGNGSPGYVTDGVAANTTKLDYPDGIVVDPIGNMYIGDAVNNRVRKVNTSGIISTIAGNGTGGYGGDACAATAGVLNSPHGLAADGMGNLYVADRNNNRIRKISYNHAPLFIAGHVQSASMCQNSTDSLNTALAITDADNAQGETWSVLSGAANGTLAASYTATSNGGAVTPTGLYYKPTIGFTGNDSFRVVVTDCSGGADTTKIVVTINPPPSAITGVSTICVGVTGALSDPIGIGAWSSNNTALATVIAGPSGTTVVTGVSAGVATITYSPGASCSVTKTVTVIAAPHSITGSPNICLGHTLTLTDSASGGTWSSASTAVASVTSGGVVTGAALGATTISYVLGGCPAVLPVTVNAIPSFISSLSHLCAGDVTVVVDGTAGGSWSTASSAIATVNPSSGLLVATGPGLAFLTYTMPTGCSSATSMVVYALPDTITGPGTICVGSSATMGDATPGGGVWSIPGGLAGAVSIDSFLGTMTGLATGTATILYTALSSQCAVSSTITVNPAPAIITGDSTVCSGSGISLTDSTTGGTWSSGSTATATIDAAAGTVSGLLPGTTLITYAAGAGCAASKTITVNPIPLGITGTTAVCVGLTTTLTDAVSGGAWSSGNTAVATVSSAGGPATVHGASSGTAVITYTLPGGCFATTTVTVNSSPGAITGTLHTCTAQTTLLGDPITGGTWASSSLGTASVNIISGLVTGGTTTGPVTITYSLGAGCSVTAVVTVNPLPAGITGTASVCAGLTTTLLDAGGTWSNTSTTIATVMSSSGVVTGVSSGTSVITFTLPTGCITTKTVTVNPVPSVPGVTLTLCPGTLTTLSSSPPGGTWSSSSTTIATIGSSTGTVGGIAPGNSVVAYTLGTGCSRSAVVTVNTLPGLFTVSGGGSLCAGGAGVPVSLGGSAAGVTYQLYNGAAPADTAVPGTGGPLSFGIKTIAGTYTVMATSNTTGCSRAMAGSAVVTVNPLPAAVTGPTAECIGANIAESDGITGGTWISGATAVATVTPGPAGGGIVWGVATGTTVLTYTLPTGCSVTDTITVSLSPVGVSGANGVCVGDTTTLTDAVSGGAWSSSNTAAATIGSLTGLVTGAAPGTTTITYSLGSGCTVTKTVTVNNSPAGISGPSGVCIGATIPLGDATGGGVWSPSAGSIATVNSSGTVKGVGTGVQVISYTVGGCAATAAVTVNPAPTAVSYTVSSVCPGNTITLGDGVSGGAWSSSNTAVASVGTSGTVTGGNGGTAVITYSLGAGCIATKTITVNPIYAISGPTGLCVGATAALSDAATGGTWSSATTTVATVTSSGTVGGASPGTSVITYTTAAGCTATTTITVNLAPSAIGGNLHVCVGATTTLSDTAGGGTWTSATTGVATVITGTGEVTGVIPGTGIITYSLGSGCIVNATVTVNPSPAAISGTAKVCAGATANLSDGTGGGTWSPATGSIATVNGAGMVSGVSAGTAIITYSPGSGCFAVKTVTVTPAPGAITGVTSVCVGLTATLSDTSAGGAWHSANTGIALVDPATGMVTAVSPGTVTITDSLFGCAAAASVVVNSAPGAIFGTMNMCIGASTALSDPTSGGAWSPATGSVATVNAAGVVSGVSIGTAAISYSVGGCPAIATVTVNPLPDNPTTSGSMNVCAGSAIILTDAPAGGTWSSPAGGGIVMVDATTGAVTGEGAGTASVTYSLGAGCTASTTVTVNPLPAAPAVVGGADNICKGYTTIVTDATGSGTWSASPDSVATITGLGIVTGTGGGAAAISYTISTGCSATTLVYVTAVPAITGATHLCAYGDTVNVYDAMPGGTWSSTLATVNTAGLVTGYAAGTATVTYTVVSGCYAMTELTVNPVPGPVMGSANVCVGTTATLSDTATSGAWSPATGSVATVSATGIVTGVSAGTAVISYTLPVTGCMRTLAVTVDPHPSVPAASISSANVCAGATLTLTDTVAGGAWSSTGASAGVATVAAATGIVSAVSAGTATITYSLAPGCTATKTITVNPLPTIYVVTGGGNYCAGTSGADIALSGADAGISYSLYHGTTAAGMITGPVSDFGMETLAGVYTVAATNTATGCVTNMPGSVTVGITPSVIPSVTMAVNPANTVCAGTAVNFTTTAANSGTSPAYQWSVNTVAVAGATSGTYSYTPADNDVVKTTLTSSATCAIPAAVSDSVTMTVVTPVTPTVNITATPGAIVKPGQSVTLTAAATGGSSYTYQWEIDGHAVAGATNATFVNTYNTADTVSCIVMGGGICNPEGSGQVVIIMSSSGSGVGVAPVNAPGADVMVIPNPNNGEFIIKGSLGTAQDEEATIEITDMLGQVVYKDKVTIHGGKLDEKVQLSKDIANGMYLLNLQSAGGNNVFHIVVAR